MDRQTAALLKIAEAITLVASVLHNEEEIEVPAMEPEQGKASILR